MEFPRIVIVPAIIALLCGVCLIWLIASNICFDDERRVFLGERSAKELEREQEREQPRVRSRFDPSQTTTLFPVDSRVKIDNCEDYVSEQGQQQPQQQPFVRPTPTPTPTLTPTPPPESAWTRFHKDDIVEDQLALEHQKKKNSQLWRQPLCTPVHLSYAIKAKRYTFQSEARDTTLYPSPAHYRMNLPVPQKNVIGIGLNLAVVPISEYNVNPFTQWIDIRVAGVTYSVQLPEGNYVTVAGNPLNIATSLQAAIVAFNPALAAFTVTLSALNNRITINTNGAPCSLLFGTGPNVNKCLWQILGFPRVDTDDLVVLDAPGTVDVTGTRAIDVFIEEIANSIDSTDNAFARIDLLRYNITTDVTFFTPPGDGVPRYFWPISRLTFLTFSFLVRYTEIMPNGTLIETYRPYLFNGRQHTMRLDVISKEYKSPLEDNIELEATG